MLFLAFFLFFVLLRYDKLTPKLFYLFTRQSAIKPVAKCNDHLLDEEEHDVVCDYEGDLVAEVSRSTTSAEQVIKQPFQLIKVSDNGDDTEAGLLAGAEFTAYLKSSLPVATS